MKCLRFIVVLLLVIGGLNWGLIGFFDYNLIANLFGGEGSTIARVIFALVGLAGLYGIAFLCGSCSCGCGSSCGSGCGCKGSCNCRKK